MVFVFARSPAAATAREQPHRRRQRRPGLDTVEIDDYRGERFLEAKSQIESLELTAARENQTTEDPSQVGFVIAQVPAPRTPLTAGEGTVTLTVGVAPATTEVPQLDRLTQSAAQAALTEAGLQLGSTLARRAR